ncbi:hypothetical protein ACJX0J_018848, partial [Zea mays]
NVNNYRTTLHLSKVALHEMHKREEEKLGFLKIGHFNMVYQLQWGIARFNAIIGSLARVVKKIS